MKRNIPSTYGQLRDDIKTIGLSSPIIRHGTPEGDDATMRFLALVLMPEEWEPVLWADQWTTRRRNMINMTQRQEATFATQPQAEGMQLMSPDEFFSSSQRGVGSIFARSFTLNTNPNSEPVRFTLVWVTDRPSDEDRATSDGYTLHPMNPQAGGSAMAYNIADCNGDGVEPPGSSYATTCNTRTMVCMKTETLLNLPGARWFLFCATRSPASGKESKIFITPRGANVTSNCAFFLYRFNTMKPVAVDILAFAAGAPVDVSGNFTLEGDMGVTDFYLITYGGDVDNFQTAGELDNAVGFEITCVSYCGQLCQIPVKDAFENISQLGKMECLAASERITNMSAPMEQQGETIVVTTTEPWTWFSYFQAQGGVSAPIFSLMANSADNWLGKAQTGGYACHLPFRATQFELGQCFIYNYKTLILQDIWWDGEDTSAVNSFCVRSTNQGAGGMHLTHP